MTPKKNTSLEASEDVVWKEKYIKYLEQTLASYKRIPHDEIETYFTQIKYNFQNPPKPVPSVSDLQKRVNYLESIVVEALHALGSTDESYVDDVIAQIEEAIQSSEDNKEALKRGE